MNSRETASFKGLILNILDLLFPCNGGKGGQCKTTSHYIKETFKKKHEPFKIITFCEKPAQPSGVKGLYSGMLPSLFLYLK